MGPVNQDIALDQMEALLDQERQLLQEGRAREAAALSGQKLEALGGVQALMESGILSGGDAALRAQVARISKRAQENTILLEAVRNGINSLLIRMSQSAAGVHVGSYGHKGAQLTFTQATGGYLKRV
ncbi:hypothetical protein [Hyphomonas sp.]|uniref:hypothetical protein n=1 Tax=Hyphomonas sp. TaxID=87 RepID=UPI00391CEEF2